MRIFKKVRPQEFRERTPEEREEILEEITNERPLIQNANEALGPENVEHFFTLLRGDVMQELDALFIHQNPSSEKDFEELYEYLAQLPEYQELCRNRLKLVFAIRDFICEGIKLNDIFEKSLKLKQGSSIVTRVSGGGRMQRKYHQVEVNNKLLKLFKYINSLEFTQKTTGVSSFRNEYLTKLTSEITALVLWRLRELADTPRKKNALQRIMTYMQEAHKNANLDDPNAVEPGVHLFNLMEHTFSVFSEHEKTFFDYTDSLPEETVFPVKERNEDLYRELKQLALFRKIDPQEEQKGEISINLVQPHDMELFRKQKALSLACVALGFLEGKERAEETVETMPQNKQKALQMFLKNKDFCFFHVEATTGELCYGSSSIPLKLILPDLEYEKLRFVVLDFLHRYLSSKEEDLDELLVSRSDEQYLDENTRKLLETGEMTRAQVQEVIQGKYGEYREHIEEVIQREEAPVSPEQDEVQQRKWEKQAFDTLCSMDSRTILSGLKRLLGEPDNISGSHYVFRVPGARPLVFPYHSAGDLVNAWTLKSALKGSDISPLELLESIDKNHAVIQHSSVIG